MLQLKKSIKAIKDAGFTHIKIELEAELNRENNEPEYPDCTTCAGIGYLPITARSLHVTICTTCNGEGKIKDADKLNFDDEGVCEQYIRNRLSKETLDALTFMQFYDDGSVDSELTYTLPIDKTDAMIEVIHAFKDLAEANGNGMDVDGAGMHITLLLDGEYPSYEQLDDEKLDNFTLQVNKLLPALYIGATSGNFTRELKYRIPQISDDQKYSAIYTHEGNCLEYRLFETCYHRPEALYEYIGVIARTIEYYVDPHKEYKGISKEYPIYNAQGFEAFMQTAEQVNIIKKQFKFIQPHGMTLKEFMKYRNINFLITPIRKKQYEKEKVAKLAYKEYLIAHSDDMTRPLTSNEENSINFLRREYPDQPVEWYWIQLGRLPQEPKSEEEYIQESINQTPLFSVAV